MSRIDTNKSGYVSTSSGFSIKAASALLTVVLAFGFGCGKKSTYKTKDGEVTVDQKNGQATIEGTTKDGNFKVSTGEKGVALPDEFPKDVPVYKGAMVQTSMQGKDMVMVHFRISGASVTDVAKYYQEQLKGQGWEIDATLNMADASTVTAKKEKRQCSITATKDDKGTMAQVVITKNS